MPGLRGLAPRARKSQGRHVLLLDRTRVLAGRDAGSQGRGSREAPMGCLFRARGDWDHHRRARGQWFRAVRSGWLSSSRSRRPESGRKDTVCHRVGSAVNPSGRRGSLHRGPSMINGAGIVRDLFVFGGSAGGYQALIEVLRRLPDSFPGTIGVALHRSPVHVSHLARLMGRRVALPVIEPVDGEAIKSGHVYLAPRDFHMTVEDHRWRLDRGPKRHLMRPAVDPLLVSAAKARGNRVVGILLSGGGGDGVNGLIAISDAGGISIAQEPDQARVKWMPNNAIRYDDVKAVLRVDEIAAVLPLLANGCRVESDDSADRQLQKG